MIEQLLDFTSIRIGDGIALRRTSLDLAELCARVMDECEAATPEGRITESSAGNTVGEWDRDRMFQVLGNLIGNALHHGSAGGEVHVECDGTELTKVSFSVHNDGMVSPDVLPMLFEPFRGTPRLMKTRGLGLGLYITRQIVSSHGGRIDVVSEPGAGTTVRVELPRTSGVAGPHRLHTGDSS